MTYDRVAKDIGRLLRDPKRSEAQREAQARLLIGLIRHLGFDETEKMMEIGSFGGKVFMSFAKEISVVQMAPKEAHQIVQVLLHNIKNAELGIEDGTIVTF